MGEIIDFPDRANESRLLLFLSAASCLAAMERDEPAAAIEPLRDMLELARDPRGPAMLRAEAIGATIHLLDSMVAALDARIAAEAAHPMARSR